MPFTLPIKKDFDSWLKYSYPDQTRLIVFKNSTYIISISGWTNENQLLIFESDYLQNNVTNTMSSLPAPNSNHMRVYTLYGMWTVCNQIAILHKWEMPYMCDNVNYTTPNKLNSLSLINNIDIERLIQQAHYERSSNSSNLNKHLDEQQILLSNRSLRVKSLLKQIDLLITATKEETSLFGDISNLLLVLLPKCWATTIINIILIFTLIISLPIIFFIILICIRCLRLLVWFYRPLFRNCLSSSFRFISLTSYLFSKVS